jgi:hypothetical protein
MLIRKSSGLQGYAIPLDRLAHPISHRAFLTADSHRPNASAISLS